ncbi:MAG: DUF6305 family protein [Vicinamibacterales bacterium]|nr:DUF6305 family protein [Vicinamibacterales bacterium]
MRRDLCLSIGMLSLLCAMAVGTPAAAQTPPTADAPVLVTSCGQSPGPVRLTVFLKRLGIEFESNPVATAKDLATKKYKTVIVVTGASLKGMGAAGVSMTDELARTDALIAEARKQNIKVVGAHVEGMARRSQGASAGDNSDEQSIDAVCPKSQLLLIRKDGDEDGRFTTISKKHGIPMLTFEKNLDIEGVLKALFAK